MMLEEVAPGIDYEKDVLPFADFPIRVSPGLKQMDERLFHPEPMFLGIEENSPWVTSQPAPVKA
jgi:acyl CoA:acetate/3-ketoacid CoA transferase